jgi:hypothetical protein
MRNSNRYFSSRKNRLTNSKISRYLRLTFTSKTTIEIEYEKGGEKPDEKKFKYRSYSGFASRIDSFSR